MTDEDTTDDTAEEEIDLEELVGQQAPEMTTFEVTAVRTFEVDFPRSRLQGLMQQTGKDQADEAVAAFFLQSETQYVDPTEKLLAVDVQADESSDD